MLPDLLLFLISASDLISAPLRAIIRNRITKSAHPLSCTFPVIWGSVLDWYMIIIIFWLLSFRALSVRLLVIPNIPVGPLLVISLLHNDIFFRFSQPFQFTNQKLHGGSVHFFFSHGVTTLMQLMHDCSPEPLLICSAFATTYGDLLNNPSQSILIGC